MKIIGLHDGHNASAALLVDGRILSAIQEERLVGVKNKGGFPINAIKEVLALNRLTLHDVDFIALAGYCNDNYNSRDDVLNRYRIELEYEKTIRGKLRAAVRDNKVLRKVYSINTYKNNLENRFKPLIDIGFDRNKIKLIEHHTSHAASAYYGYGKYDEPVLILTCDGAGDGLCATINIGQKGQFERIASVPEGESIARIYAMMTYLMGMVPLEHEYKIMGLAPYAGNSKNVNRIFERFNSLFEFNPKKPLQWYRQKSVPAVFYLWETLEAIMHRERFDYISAGLQVFIEHHMSQWVRNCIKETGIKKVAVAGGIFMNVKMNKVILELPEVDELFIFPSCGDETNAIGAAFYAYNQARINNKDLPSVSPLKGVYWGGEFANSLAEEVLSIYTFKSKVTWEYIDDIERKIAELLANGEVVARAKGRMEFGARALGNRSILAGADNIKSLRRINDMIKCRDFWMPLPHQSWQKRA
ncbi:MAG: carbamoyltransferase [Candidatus Brocadia sapporoensis]|nr:MAG: carbamoyltransferase [Candidatus Brocadia sapporoensis]